MFRLSLILTLAAFQLLGGSGRSVYLCVSSNGDLCCLDSGPLSCACCRHEADSTSHNDAGGDAASEECASKCCHGEGDESCPDDHHSPKSKDGPTLANDGCSCTHELISTGQVGSILRSSMTDQVSAAVQLLDCLPTAAHPQAAVAFDGPVNWQGPPPIPNSALAVLSTIVIRC